jgi:uncharacterized membrane protein
MRLLCVPSLHGAAGGLLMGAVFAITASMGGAVGGVPPPALGFSLLLGVVAGVVGSLLDSVMGATLQYSGLDAASGKVYNRPVKGLSLTRIAGKDWMSNSAVNFWSATITALAAMICTAGVW